MKTSEYPSEVVTQKRLIQDLEESFNRAGNAWYTKMPETKIVKFLKQFSWVRRFINPDDISQVYVSGIDPAMIFRPLRYQDSDFSVSREYAFLVDEHGDLVSRMIEKTVTSKKYIFFGPVRTEKRSEKITGNVDCRSTIWDTLNELGDEVEKIKFLFSFDTWTKVAIVYKRPKGTDFWKWIEDEIDVQDKTAE